MFSDGFTDPSSSSQFSVEPNFGVPKQIGLLPCPDCGVELPASTRVCPHDGTDLLLRHGQIFADKYELGSVIGFGGMGVIYKAKHLILDKIVAIKVLHSTAASSKVIMRFQREAKAASSLSHPNVITVYDFGVFDGMQPYMVMDYLDGMTLADYASQAGPLPLRETLEIIEQVTAALTHAHKKGVLHRDLKPGNIMLFEDDDGHRQIKILDFGLAKIVDDDQVGMSAPGSAMGSPAYMSPEQATGLIVDLRSDLYSLGCIFYELLTGAPPLIADNPTQTFLNRLNMEVPPLRAVVECRYPQALENILSRLLRKEPRHRFESADDLKFAISDLWPIISAWENNPQATYEVLSKSSRSSDKRQKYSNRGPGTRDGDSSSRRDHGRKAISRPVKTIPDWKGVNLPINQIELTKPRPDCPNLTRTRTTETIQMPNRKSQPTKSLTGRQAVTQALNLAQLQRLDLLPLSIAALTIVVTVLILATLH